MFSRDGKLCLILALHVIAEQAGIGKGNVDVECNRVHAAHRYRDRSAAGFSAAKAVQTAGEAASARSRFWGIRARNMGPPHSIYRPPCVPQSEGKCSSTAPPQY